MSSPHELSNICIITQKNHIHSLKLALEHRGSFKKKAEIQKINSEEHLSEYITKDGFRFSENLVAIPTTLTAKGATVEDIRASITATANELYAPYGLAQDIAFAVLRSPACSADAGNVHKPEDRPKSLLALTIHHWLAHLPPTILSALPPTTLSVLTRTSWTYTIYSPLLLLPAPTSKTDSWPWLLSAPLAPYIPALYAQICANLHITHIALNAPIPLSSPSKGEENIFRSPIAFTPLHGNFGTLQPPSPEAFGRAFWVSTRQHGVYQTWAPLYTMFSRGNIAEKARILQMPELTVDGLGYSPAESSAVDLYAGIGYFAFCYAKAGVGRVLCWELNAWSVEGLRKGGRGNGWSVRLVEEDDKMGEEDRVEFAEERLIVFREDNQRARTRIEKLRSHIPPIRHVNCGFLPSSSASWPIAVAVLDPIQGGWIHAHENIAVTDIESRNAQIVHEFHALANPDANYPHWNVQCHHLQRVKTYAPGVMHCVLDICISPAPANANATPTLPMLEAPS